MYGIRLASVVSAACLLSLLAGCSGNQVTVENVADGDIYFNFRAQRYAVASGGVVEITDIPNGTYEFATTVEIPRSGVTFADGGGLAGEMAFERSSSEFYLLISSVLDTTTYTVFGNLSSTNSTAGVTGTE